MSNIDIEQHKSKTVRQSNALTTSAYCLGRNAKRILYLSLIQLSDKERLVFNHDEMGFEVVIKHSDYSNISNDANNASAVVARAAAEMYDSSIVVYSPNEDGSDGEKAFTARRWIVAYKHEPKKRQTTLFFNKSVVEMIPYKKGLPFTQYLLISATNLKNSNTMRLYELICQWRGSRTSLKLEINWVLSRFSLPKSYERMADFRSKFLSPAQKDITENTDISFWKWDEHCEGDRKNKVTHITIHWKEKSNKEIGDELSKPYRVSYQIICRYC